jgi:mono/diheme cytochrome c family protein
VRSRIAFIVVAACAACNADATGGSMDGPVLYARLCAMCHGPDGVPPEAMARTLGVRDLTSAELRARVTPELVEQQVRRGSPNKLMPPFEGLVKPAQLKALAAFVASPAFLDPR